MKQRGWTLIEVLIVAIVVAIVTGIAYANYGYFAERARIAAAVGGIGEIYMKVNTFDLNNRRYPDSLDEMGLAGELDPWGNPYQYLAFNEVDGNGPKRKNKSMVPVNSSYDIYSMGPDGLSETPFTSIPGRDDIVMAGDGTYFGSVANFE
jgi:general secretion pathway protein G